MPIIFTGSSQLLSRQNETLIVNVSQQVILNCTASSSPDPVYNWSFPDSCSSCPQLQHSNVLNFTADIIDSEKYICEMNMEMSQRNFMYMWFVSSQLLVTNVRTYVCSYMHAYTVCVKSFEGENFQKVLLTVNVLPLKIFCFYCRIIMIIMAL